MLMTNCLKFQEVRGSVPLKPIKALTKSGVNIFWTPISLISKDRPVFLMSKNKAMELRPILNMTIESKLFPGKKEESLFEVAIGIVE